MKQNYTYKIFLTEPTVEYKVEQMLNRYSKEGFRLHTVIPVSENDTTSFHTWILEAPCTPISDSYPEHLADLEYESSKEAAIEAEQLGWSKCDDDDGWDDDSFSL